jgi:hypothetical protein
MIIRYYFLQGRATFVTDGNETPLTNTEFHDFILNKKEKMKLIENPAAKQHRKFVDYES